MSSADGLERTGDGEMVLGSDGQRGIHHPIRNGAAVCLPTMKVTNVKPISQVPLTARCQRNACRSRWSKEKHRGPVADPGDVEYVCQNCLVERERGTKTCPSCGTAYPAVPASATAAA